MKAHLVVAVLAAFSTRVGAQAVDASRLPLIEVPATTGRTIALVVSGDGGWAAGDRALASALARGGVAVVGLDARAYLRAAPRTPDGTARDAAAILQRYATRWHRDRLVFVGYSRGADLAPFVVSRWPEALRQKLALVALVGLAEHASFTFHWQDLVRDVARPSDLAVRPELEQLRGTPLLCLYGEDERGSLCPTLDAGLARVVRHAGKHELDATSGDAVGRLLVEALRS